MSATLLWLVVPCRPDLSAQQQQFNHSRLPFGLIKQGSSSPLYLQKPPLKGCVEKQEGLLKHILTDTEFFVVAFVRWMRRRHLPCAIPDVEDDTLTRHNAVHAKDSPSKKTTRQKVVHRVNLCGSLGFGFFLSRSFLIPFFPIVQFTSLSLARRGPCQHICDMMPR